MADPKPLRFTIRRRVFLAIVLIANGLLWAIPSTVVELVARDMHTLMGRYSRTHFTWILAVLILSIVGLYIDWARPEHYKKRWFQLAITLIVLAPALAVADFGVRWIRPGAYMIHDGLAYRRVPNVEYPARFEDRPLAARSYPNVPPGYGTLECPIRTDARGYRNPEALDACDVLVLGDSFAEGSSVAGDQTWPAQLAASSDLRVYNLGMSGYSPIHYRASLEAFGIALRPKYVLCLLYEGNDFRIKNLDRAVSGPGFTKRVGTYIKRSPLLQAADQLMIRTFGSVLANAPVNGIDILSWLPVAVSVSTHAGIPEGAEPQALALASSATASSPRLETDIGVTTYYAFAPKQLLSLCESSEAFAVGRYWNNVAAVLTDMNRMCDEVGATLVVVFAPTKAHVVLPLVLHDLPTDKVHAFAQLRAKDGLPAPDKLIQTLAGNIGARETAVRRWCDEHAIAFVSLTEPLRDAITSGTQTYYTYDQHWSPSGHRVVAETLRAHLEWHRTDP